MPYEDGRTKEYQRKYYETHKEQLREYQKQYRKSYPDKAREQRRSWHATHSADWREKRRAGRFSNLIQCYICGRNFAFISGKHLRMHELTIEEYKTQFPDAPIVIASLGDLRGKASSNRAAYRTYKGKSPDIFLFEFLVGTMLGDGSLECKKKNARYADGGSNQLYMQWKHEILSRYFATTIKQRTSRPDKRTGKEYTAWFVRTCSHPFLTEWHERWYTGAKHLDKELIIRYLTPFALAIWFFDDGNNGTMISLYTLAFTVEDVEWLAALLFDRFGLKTTIQGNKQGQAFIHIRAESKPTFLDLIRPYCAPGMEYKLGKKGGASC